MQQITVNTYEDLLYFFKENLSEFTDKDYTLEINCINQFIHNSDYYYYKINLYYNDNTENNSYIHFEADCVRIDDIITFKHGKFFHVPDKIASTFDDLTIEENIIYLNNDNIGYYDKINYKYVFDLLFYSDTIDYLNQLNYIDVEYEIYTLDIFNKNNNQWVISCQSINTFCKLINVFKELKLL